MPNYVRCGKCSFEGVQKQAVKHYLHIHTPLEKIPYFCMLCKFRALTQKKWDNHIVENINHKRMSEKCRCKLSDTSYCKIGKVEFKLKIEAGGDLIPIQKPTHKESAATDLRKVVPKEAEKSEVELRVNERENVFEYEEEISKLQEKMKTDKKEFERYITKMETTKSSMEKEIRSLREELKEEKKKGLRTELKETIDQLESVREDRKERKRVASEVHKVDRPVKHGRNRYGSDSGYDNYRRDRDYGYYSSGRSYYY